MDEILNDIIREIECLKIKSLGTKRSGDYRIGLSMAVDIIQQRLFEGNHIVANNDVALINFAKHVIEEFELGNISGIDLYNEATELINER